MDNLKRLVETLTDQTKDLTDSQFEEFVSELPKIVKMVMNGVKKKTDKELRLNDLMSKAQEISIEVQGIEKSCAAAEALILDRLPSAPDDVVYNYVDMVKCFKMTVISIYDFKNAFESEVK